MPSRMEDLQATVRARICALCSTRTAEGACGAEQPESCSLQTLFPLIAEAVMATQSDNLQSYVDAIHENVCSVCIDQRLDGSCPQREEKCCALDAYMPQIVEAIEEAIGRPLRPGKTASAR